MEHLRGVAISPENGFEDACIGGGETGSRSLPLAVAGYLAPASAGTCVAVGDTVVTPQQMSQPAPGGEPFLLPQEAEQDVFGPDVVVFERARLVLCENDDLAGSFGETFEQMRPFGGLDDHRSPGSGAYVCPLYAFLTLFRT